MNAKVQVGQVYQNSRGFYAQVRVVYSDWCFFGPETPTVEAATVNTGEGRNCPPSTRIEDLLGMTLIPLE